MYLEHRDSGFPKLINELNLEIGVEVGVREGGYSERLLRDSNIKLLFGIDVIQYRSAKNLETKYNNRYKLIIIPSPDVSLFFKDNYFDFIHIDAWHSYESCKMDLNAWWPKLKKGGVFCGDDYIVFDNPKEGKYGVVEAVEEFVKYNNLKVYVTGLLDSDKRIEWATEQGIELSKKFADLPNNFQQTPNWYLIK